MRKFNALFGTLAGAALTFACVHANAESAGDSHAEFASDGATVIMLAQSSANSEPAMGGEGDGAVGGNVPEPERSAGTMVDDGKITAEVKTKLLADTTVSGLKIDVDTRKGVVYLTGDNIRDQAAIDRAISLASETSGVVDVVSKLATVDIKR